MRSRILVLSMLLAFVLTGSATAGSPNDHSYWDQKKSQKAKQPKKRSRGDKKSYAELIKDKVEIEGLFTFYKDTTDQSMLMAIKPEHIGPTYLCGMSMSRGDGAYSEGSRMYGTYPFYLKRIGDMVMLMERNLRFRADTASPMFGAVESSVSDGLIASVKIQSEPHDSTEAVLVDPADLFIRDALNMSYFVGQVGRTGLRFDSKHSYFGEVKSFPQNSEIDVHLHYASQKPQSAPSLQNPYSFFHVLHYSLSTLPETDYVPRLADDRVGHFLTMYQNFDKLDTEDNFVRYINRWHLKKKNPDARISAPVEPIVFWIENTVPEEYRDAVAEGIEFWNQSFEKIGFRNAIIAKQMPDTATWDPADVRYNTIRWIVVGNIPYVAIGPSRANPFTGQIYDADVGFVANTLNGLFNVAERRVEPVSALGKFEEYDPFGEIPSEDAAREGHFCQIGQAGHEAALGMAYLMATTGDFEGKGEATREYVRSFITFVIAHEVGHTLGFRHNFIASTIYDINQINDPEFTEENGMVGTVMEYPSANLALPGEKQGEYYPRMAGPYDDWVIEYAYSDFGAETPQDEIERLNEIASRAGEEGLAYATDEDAYGSSMKSINPLTNVWDIGSDPIAFLDRETKISETIWTDLIHEFEKPGVRYQKIRNVFQTSFTPFFRTALIVPKYVGGIYHRRYHVGNVANELPFEPVSAADQRRAVAFLNDKIFSADAFNLSADLYNKLQQENMPDFQWSHYTRATIDYPLHQTVMSVQQAALSRLYSHYVLYRLVNNLNRFEDGEEKYTMYEMFNDVRGAIWSELDNESNVNSMRRQLQLAHLDRIVNIYLASPKQMPMDARTLAAHDLQRIRAGASEMANNSGVDGMTRAHFEEVVRQIDAAREARREYDEG